MAETGLENSALGTHQIYYLSINRSLNRLFIFSQMKYMINASGLGDLIYNKDKFHHLNSSIKPGKVILVSILRSLSINPLQIQIGKHFSNSSLNVYRVFFLFWLIWHVHNLVIFWAKIEFLDIFHIYVPIIFYKKNFRVY